MVLDSRILKRCVAAGMCDKGIAVWHDTDRLMTLAKKEVDFLLKTRVLSHKEIIDLLGLEYLNGRSIYIDQELNTSINSPDIYSAFLGCTGCVRVYTNNNIFKLADSSELEVRVLSEGVLTIRLYSGSVLDLAVKRNAQVMIFNYGGIVRKVVGDDIGYVQINNLIE